VLNKRLGSRRGIVRPAGAFAPVIAVLLVPACGGTDCRADPLDQGVPAIDGTSPPRAMVFQSPRVR
jgi:hypothetical protein